MGRNPFQVKSLNEVFCYVNNISFNLCCRDMYSKSRAKQEENNFKKKTFKYMRLLTFLSICLGFEKGSHDKMTFWSRFKLFKRLFKDSCLSVEFHWIEINTKLSHAFYVYFVISAEKKRNGYFLLWYFFFICILANLHPIHDGENL